MRVVVSALLIAEVAMKAPKDHSSGYPGGCATLHRPDGDFFQNSSFLHCEKLDDGKF